MKTKQITIELKNGKEITTEVEFTISREKYGADADGNRYEWRSYQEENYDSKDVDDNGIRLTSEEKEEYENKLLEKFETVEIGEDDRDDYDEGDR
jgi:hypothetical protein